ncbi:MAG: DUF2971 domain-containing protein [Methylovulum sp.]|nr:DUF2971 domain-containing protein [Methylovulum sp.]
MSDTILRYKYLPLDDSFKNKDSKDYKPGSLCVVRDFTIKFTAPMDFNDPFDCHPELDEQAMEKFLVEKEKQSLKEHKKNSGLSPDKYFQEKRKLESHREKSKELFTNNNFLKKMNPKIGICSLSKNPLNLLMWAHYATQHAGFVVEFAISQNLSGGTLTDDVFHLNPTPIVYTKEKPIVTDGSVESIEKWILTKSKDWEYEQEERVFNLKLTENNPNQGRGIHLYNKKILKSVIAGMKMSDDDFRILEKTVDTVNREHDMNISVHRAQPVKGKFALSIPDRKDLDIHNNV